MAVTLQDRPNLLLRDDGYHPIYAEGKESTLSGISRVLDVGESLDRTIEKLQERLGGKHIRNMTQVGSDYPSAGHSAERVDRYIGEVMPTP